MEEVAGRLWAAAESGTPCPPVRSLLPEGDVAAAYAVQTVNTRRSLAAGRRMVGRKIGLTSPAVQRQLGVSEPDYGILFADMAMPDGIEIPSSRLIQPRVEAEVAFVLGRDLDQDQVTMADLVRAVDHVLPAIEIVDSRIAAWDIRLVDTIADNASSGLYVLGGEARPLAGLDLRLAGMVLEQGGEPLSTGAGAACLGNPLNAACWLAGVMARGGWPLKAGDTILSGALGPMVDVRKGAVYDARISGLGSVRAVFSKE
ncbi:MAG: 2-keto-4-pentenoate hydratase [Telmatospirillum sp.]|nr:2-keto-4-pentenoate hydratase [Telmatospirillum sp.]